MKNNLIKFFLLLCILIGFVLRIYDINWDQGFHLQPDERAIVLYTLPIKMPTNFINFLSINSPLNPHFFAYGSFPIYLLKITSQLASIFNPLLSQYAQINLVGRFMSAIFDSGTIFLIYLITKNISSRKNALISSFIYSITVLPIQLSHFYAVDTLLTFFIILAIYRLIIFYEKPTIINSLIVGFAIGFSLATKISGLALIAAVGATSLADFMLLFLKNPHKSNIWFPHISKYLKKFVLEGLLIFLTSIIIFILLEPYAVIDFTDFINQTLQQSQMTHNAFIFPYTLQYVGIIPYYYEIKNIFLWGEGPIIGILSLIGFVFSVKKIFNNKNQNISSKILIILVFFLAYFVVVGRFAIGFMRYMLPIYPILAIFASFPISFFEKKVKDKIIKIISSLILVILITSWTFTFMNIYQKPNIRVSATDFINSSIKPRSNIAIEHWDDRLPLFNQQQFNMITLPLYDQDTQNKWMSIDNSLNQTDYIIIASNRLYVPLQKLTNCSNLPLYSCYPITANYYKALFSGKNVIQIPNQYEGNKIVKFKKIITFINNPIIPFLDIPVNDQGADESFTVYDHPKIIIFKKE